MSPAIKLRPNPDNNHLLKSHNLSETTIPSITRQSRNPSNLFQSASIFERFLKNNWRIQQKEISFKKLKSLSKKFHLNLLPVNYASHHFLLPTKINDQKFRASKKYQSNKKLTSTIHSKFHNANLLKIVLFCLNSF